MMKLTCMLLTILFLASAGISNAQDAKEKSAKLAATVMIKERIDQLAERNIDAASKFEQQVDEFQKIILLNTQLHKVKKESKDKLKEVYHKRVNSELDEIVKEAHHQLNKDYEYFSLKWLEDYINDTYGKEIKDAIEKNVDVNFEELYRTARDRAVSKQNQNILKRIYPEPHEVELSIEHNWQNRQEMRTRLLERMSGSLQQPMLEEVEQHAGEMADSVIEDCRTQSENQRRAVREISPPEDAITEEQIRSSLEMSINNAITSAKQKAEPGRTVYPLFNDSKAMIQVRAADLERDRFGAFIESFHDKFDATTIHSIIMGNINNHIRKDASRELTVSTLLPEFTRKCITDYAQRTNVERRHFTDKLNKYAEDNEQISRDLRKSLERSFEEPWKSARSTIVREQLGANFPTLVSGEWILDEPAIVKYIDQHGTEEQPKVLSFRECLSYMNIKEDSPEVTSFLEETQQELSEKFRPILMEARAAWNGQNSLVIKDDITQEIGRNARIKDPQQWFEHFRTQISDKWRKQREKTIWPEGSSKPDNANRKYVNLFEHVEQRIRTIVEQSLRRPPPPRWRWLKQLGAMIAEFVRNWWYVIPLLFLFALVILLSIRLFRWIRDILNRPRPVTSSQTITQPTPQQIRLRLVATIPVQDLGASLEFGSNFDDIHVMRHTGDTVVLRIGRDAYIELVQTGNGADSIQISFATDSQAEAENLFRSMSIHPSIRIRNESELRR